MQKEDLPSIKFQASEVARNVSEQASLIKNLFQAMILGNSYQSKVKIRFNTTEGLRFVETTIWAKTDDWIVLKGGNYIPISSICGVDQN